MLWRSPAQQSIRENVKLPSDQGNVFLIGAFELSARLEIGHWSRLAEGAGLFDRTIVRIFSERWSEQERILANSLWPRSWSNRVELVDDAAGVWWNLVQPAEKRDTFAAVTDGEVANLLVVGAPSELSWEMLLSRAT